MPEEHEILTLDAEVGEVELRDESKREIDVRVMPWNVVISHQRGPETFERGAFAGIDPRKILLKGVDPEGTHRGPIIGAGRTIEERDDGGYVTFRVSKTQAGDDNLALLSDGIHMGASPGFYEVDGGTTVQQRNGKRVRVHQRVGVEHVALTYRPAYRETAVIAMRSAQEGDARMGEPQEATPVVAAEPAVPAVVPTIDTSAIEKAFEGFAEKMEDRLHRIEERNRQNIIIPQPTPTAPTVHKGQWLQTALQMLSGERVSEKMLQERALADLITTDNLGVVPEAFSSELIGIIDAGRPFLGSTRRVPTPSGGMTLNFPVLTTRPTAGVQVNEKDDITSTTTSITNSGFDAVTIAGGGDISLQLLKRSEPSYLSLYLELLAEAVSANAEAEALDALLNAGVTPGTGTLDPEALAIGEAWTNAQATRQRADTIWMSSAAVEGFLDAKADGTNLPLYGALAADFSASNGVGGRIMGLRPVYVPALDGTGTDVMIGPSRGFAWAEDGAFELQVDVPSKLGRDVALAVIDWYAPLYPEAFTTWAV